MMQGPGALEPRWKFPKWDWRWVHCSRCGVSNADQTMLEPSSATPVCIPCAKKEAGL